MNENQDKSPDELCSAGKILQVKFDTGINKVEGIAKRLEKSLDSMTKTMLGNSKGITASVSDNTLG